MSISSQTVVIATRNQGKVREFERFFQEIGKKVISLLDVEGVPDIEEDGATFAENAAKKAMVVAKELGIPVLADDSGLCVDVLDGAPGVYSARYAGVHADDAANNTKLLTELGQRELSIRYETAYNGEQVKLLSPAQFVCVLAYFNPDDQRIIQAEGECPGWIAAEPRGNGGFGYDPLFYMPAHQMTMAELDPIHKNRISHRAQAMEKLGKLLRSANA